MRADLLICRVLCEDRLPVLQQKWANLDFSHDRAAVSAGHKPEDIVSHMASMVDPTPNKQYTDRALQWYSKKQFRLEDHGRVRRALDTFHRVRQRMPVDAAAHHGVKNARDINSYKSVHDVFDQTHREHEVLADVTGLKPNVLQFDNGKHVSAQEKLWAVQDMLHGAPHAKDGASYVQDRKKGHTFYHDDAEAAQEYDATFRQARKHFRVDLDEAVLRPFRCSCGHSWVDEDTPSGRACHACPGGKGKPFAGESADSLISYVLEGGDDDDLDPKDMLDKGIFDLGVKRQQQGAPKKPSPQTADTRPWAKCSSCGKRHRLRPAFMPWDSRPDSERVNDALCVRCERYHRASLSGD